ncbi:MULTISPECIES: TVP38/TMEM64 family protein [Paenibacillus]|uniref:TVP38/TMEM64 family protein n=1 Tax=Paenibacillus TaxID=44249 RepID=UPI0022B8CFCF|nr:TVP38/TMEM64 family protein [Paenibacillus caseinilyticus]MCZ8522054.1 TVP38/TMEM64 family protein [Paenibacillus caseinilyticus]
MIRKLGLGIVYVGIAYLLYLYGSRILDWMQGADNLLLVILAASLMALFPVIPYPVVGGVIGAAFGPLLGGAVTWTGSTAASLLMFLFVRYGYREWGERLLHGGKGLDKLTAAFERNAFLSILFTRMIPFVPSIFVNVYCALSRVPFLTYAAASALGKVPAMLLFALAGDNLASDPKRLLGTLAGYGVFLAVMAGLNRLWKRKQGLPVGKPGA